MRQKYDAVINVAYRRKHIAIVYANNLTEAEQMISIYCHQNPRYRIHRNVRLSTMFSTDKFDTKYGKRYEMEEHVIIKEELGLD